jgi:bifunctional DNA-binding transcriptional regulator/antitoxin component of YhaV-PrlF toxin-antitoxin module
MLAATVTPLTTLGRPRAGAPFPAVDDRVRPTNAAPAFASEPARDGVTRVGALAALDRGHRVNAAKALRALGWTTGDRLVAHVQGRSAVLTRRAQEKYADVPVRVDEDHRLLLPPAVVARLDLGTGAQVLLIAIPGTGELHVVAAADALCRLTGPLADPTPVPTDAQAPAGAPPRRTSIRPPFRPAG